MRNVGIDIVEFDEIKERLSNRFIERILSEKELVQYHKITNTERKISYLAGRFAAKEAYTKAYQTFDKAVNFRDVTILNKENGAPYLISNYNPKDTIEISISHSRNYAVAICILEKENE
jgi:holo-[acyl-carrier protein] synthase